MSWETDETTIIEFAPDVETPVKPAHGEDCTDLICPPPQLGPEPIAIGHLLYDAPNSGRASPRTIRYLEGLRGLAAFFVVLDHIFRFTLVNVPMDGWQATVRDGIGWLMQGRVCVDLFIVLSGYLLMRPAVATGKLPGGMFAYLRRRARRILPPYYAALAITIILLLAVSCLAYPLAPEWQDAVPALSMGSIMAHVVMVQDLSFHWAAKIDPPMWSVAVEWQVYFLFPLLLLPLWRRLGNLGVMACATLLGVGGYLMLGHGQSAAPWYLGLFTFGMAAATRAHVSPRSRRRYLFWAFSLMLIYAIVTLECAFGRLRFITTGGIEMLWPYNWAFDLPAGAASACLLVYLVAAAEASKGRNFLVRNLSRPSIAFLGVTSYSLYLIHDPLLALMTSGLNALTIGPWEQFGALVAMGIPALLLITWPFHLMFEKPFMSTGMRRSAMIETGNPLSTPKRVSAAIGNPNSDEEETVMSNALRTGLLSVQRDQHDIK